MGTEVLITERERLDLVKKLEEALGTTAATTLMEYLPASGWRDVATTTDLENVRLALTSDIDHVRHVLTTDIAGVRRELHTGLAGVRSELHTGLADLRSELHTGLAGVRRELHTEIAGLRTDMARGFQRMTLTYVGTMVSFGGLLVAAASITRR